MDHFSSQVANVGRPSVKPFFEFLPFIVSFQSSN